MIYCFTLIYQKLFRLFITLNINNIYKTGHFKLFHIEIIVSIWATITTFDIKISL
jgi:hypothetical protein